MIENFQKIFNQFKTPSKEVIESRFLLEFLNEYVNKFHFEFPIEGRLLMKAVHPYHGHLLNIKKGLSFESLVNFWRVLSLATNEISQG